jgi:NADH dehydrogenase FAD-containing subunit
MRSKEEFARPLESLVAPHFAHLASNAKTLNPSSNSLTLENGDTVKYDYLVVAPGLKSSALYYRSKLDTPTTS